VEDVDDDVAIFEVVSWKADQMQFTRGSVRSKTDVALNMRGIEGLVPCLLLFCVWNRTGCNA